MLKVVSSRLEWRSNKNCQLVAFENSKALCDFENPRVEAEAWVKSQVCISGDPKKIVVIGVGSGFHLEALAEAYPFTEIIAVDCRNSLVGFCARRMKNIQFLNFSDIKEIMTYSGLKDLMEGSTIKITFAPAFGVQKRLLDEIFFFLNIRTREALSFYLNKPIEGDDNILVNLRHLFQYAGPRDLSYKTSEVLTLREIIK